MAKMRAGYLKNVKKCEYRWSSYKVLHQRVIQLIMNKVNRKFMKFSPILFCLNSAGLLLAQVLIATMHMCSQVLNIIIMLCLMRFARIRS